MNILIISKTKIDSDPRPRRQVEYFSAQHWHVDTLSLQDKNSASINKYILSAINHTKFRTLWRAFLLAVRKFEAFYADTLSFDPKVIENKYDLIIAHDLVTVPMAFLIKNKTAISTKIIIDLHEYLPSQKEDNILWNWFYKPYVHYMCKKYLHCVEGNVAVNDTIAEKYSTVYQINRPHVVRNIPKSVENIFPVPVSDSKIRLIHHGIAFPSRGSDVMIKMMKFLDPDKFELNLIFVNKEDDPYLKYLREQARKYRNINFLKPVSFEKIISFTNQFDIGVFLLPPLTYNYHYALPNKLFEFIHANLAVAIGPSPEMEKIVNQFQVGVVSKSYDPESLAKEIANLDSNKINYFKAQSHKASKILNADFEMVKYIDFVKKLTGKSIH